MSLAKRLTVLSTAVALSLSVSVATLASPAAGAVAQAPVQASEDFAPGRVLVKYRPGVDTRQQSELERSHGAAQASDMAALDVSVLTVPAGAEARVVAALSRSGKVEYAERDVVVRTTSEVTPNDPWFRYQWGVRNTRSSTAWSTTTGHQDVVIAVLDSGLTLSNEFTGKVLAGRNVLDGSSDVTDSVNHGTGAASVAAVASDNGDGIAGYCWACMILPVKVMNSTGYLSDVANGVVWATDQGADVISMSLSGPSGSATMESAVRYAAGRDVVLVAAAGNSGSTTPVYPAAYPEVIGVAGSTSSDTLYSWSNRGAWVDLSAPGEHQSVGNDGNIWGYSGTSSATPAVAGIAGLALSLDSRPTAAQVREALNAGAVSIGDGVRYGRVDAQNTLTALTGTQVAPPAAPSVAISTPTSGSTVTGVVTVTGTAASNDTAAVSRVDVTVGGSTLPASGTGSWSASVDTAGLAEGVVRITATATTSNGASAATSVDVVVERPAPVSAPALTVTTSKVKGANVAGLQWDGVVGAPARVLRNGTSIATVSSGTSFTDRTGTKGGTTSTYQVCGPAGCTASVTATW